MAEITRLARAAVAATLCAGMVGQPVWAQAPVVRASASPGKQIEGQARVLHALNRLTFGPRPGDLAAVEAMGLNRWFEMQLNPGSINDSALEARLAQYPAMGLTIAQLEARYPGPQEIRQIEAGKLGLPSDPTQRAMVEDQLAFYQMKKAQQAGKAAAADAPAMPPGATGAQQMAPDGEDATTPDDAATTQAFPKEETQRILALAPDQRFQAVMSMTPDDLVRFRQSLKGGQAVALANGLAPWQRETLEALPGSLRMVALEETESRVVRDVYSERQLEAVMTDFWLNHFNVYLRKNQQEPYLIPTYERVVREHALGNFEDLLVATAESPAMLEYLDNARSIGPDSQAAERVKRAAEMRPDGKAAKGASAGLNENYGRELMELHTLGVNGGYTQADVTQVAKVFTGWTIDKDTKEFVFNERRHEPGSKVVLGKKIKENGVNEGLEVLHMLATSPATAHFICQKLAVRFVSDTPPPALVDRMAASFLASKGDIKTVLRTMWNSPELWSPDIIRAKVKTPEEFVISAVRASGAEVINPAALVQSEAKLGMPLYGMQTPNGYGWKQEDWVNTGALVARMNFALVLSAGRIPGVRTDWTGILGETQPGVIKTSFEEDPAAKERRLEAALLEFPVSDRTRQTVIGQANDGTVTEQATAQFDLRGGGGKYPVRGLAANAKPSPDDPQAAVMAGLLLGSPEFQRR